MKQVFMIIESHQFRDYLRLKLKENGVDTYVANNPGEGITKLRNIAPDLIILDYHIDHKGLIDLLKQKKLGVNTANTPVVILARKLEHKQLLELVPYNIKKVFNKPVKIDALFSIFSETLGIPFYVDENPGIVEVHINENIIFIEIAKGLNRDKIDLLRFKLSELTVLYKTHHPRIIIMFSDIKLGPEDAPVMRKLFNIVIESAKAKPDGIRILTNEEFVEEFLEGEEDYSGTKVFSNLQLAIDDLLKGIGKNKKYVETKAEFIGDKILSAKTKEGDGDSLALKFEAEEKKISLELFKDFLQNLRIAVVDDDVITQVLISRTFQETGALIYTFSDGDEFLETVDEAEYDLAFVDLRMPRVDGFEVLKALQARLISYPVIVLSSVSQREAMIKAIQMGVKSYLVKPLTSNDIFMKSIEILKANF